MIERRHCRQRLKEAQSGAAILMEPVVQMPRLIPTATVGMEPTGVDILVVLMWIDLVGAIQTGTHTVGIARPTGVPYGSRLSIRILQLGMDVTTPTGTKTATGRGRLGEGPQEEIATAMCLATVETQGGRGRLEMIGIAGGATNGKTISIGGNIAESDLMTTGARRAAGEAVAAPPSGRGPAPEPSTVDKHKQEIDKPRCCRKPTLMSATLNIAYCPDRRNVATYRQEKSYLCRYDKRRAMPADTTHPICVPFKISECDLHRLQWEISHLKGEIGTRCNRGRTSHNHGKYSHGETRHRYWEARYSHSDTIPQTKISRKPRGWINHGGRSTITIWVG